MLRRNSSCKLTQIRTTEHLNLEGQTKQSTLWRAQSRGNEGRTQTPKKKKLFWRKVCREEFFKQKGFFHRGERRVRVRVKTSDSSNCRLAKIGFFFFFFLANMSRQHLLEPLPLCTFLLPACWSAPSAYWGNHLKMRKHNNMATGGWFLDIVPTSAVAAVLFQETVARLRWAKCWSKL